MARARPPVGRLILDSGAIIGWSRGDPRIRAELREALARGRSVRAPVVVLTETLRAGPRDAAVNRVLKLVGAAPTEPSIGRTAGGLLGRTGGRNTADALVAAEAMQVPRSVVLTSDPDDLTALLVDEPEIDVVRV